MIRTLQELGPWQIVAAVAVLALALVLFQVFRVRRRKQRAVRREVWRLQREFATRDALESQEDRRL